jgi:hypothetical protein
MMASKMLLVLIVWGIGSAVVGWRALRRGDSRAELVPRCARCGGMREFRHRCSDAIADVDAEVVDRLSELP